VERSTAAGRFETLELRAREPVVGLTLAGGTPRREWLAERWAAASRAIDATGANILVFAGPGEEERLSRFRSAGGTGAIVSSSLRELFGLLTHCSVFASCDSGPAHFAMALGVPTVTVYSRDHAALWNPGRPETIALSAPAERPCAQCDRYGRKSDHLIHDCVQSITPEEVAHAVQRAISTS
jgi:ADP-heptose:LPS heptosyltransferase